MLSQRFFDDKTAGTPPQSFHLNWVDWAVLFNADRQRIDQSPSVGLGELTRGHFDEDVAM
jgi:hypothetical protein